MLVFILIMSVALSIDALSIGISYRIRGIRIPFFTKFIVGLVTSLLMFIAQCFGSLLNEILSGTISKIIGVGVLLIIGIIFIKNSLFGGEESTYDLDHSRDIDAWEGILLAIALSADSISAGVAAATTGFSSIWISVFVGVMQFVFLIIGDTLVNQMQFLKSMSPKVCGTISGILLIFIGIFRLVC